MRARVSAERVMNAPADVVYHCIADYLAHHRPDGFLPPAFSAFEIEDGGVGADELERLEVYARRHAREEAT